MTIPVILIVEDDEPSYMYLASLVDKVPCSIVRAHNGREAVDICIRRDDIGIVLMDLKMPVMDGLDATCEIKGIREDLPIIVITAYAFSIDEKAVMAAGGDAYLTKPVKKEHLYRIMAKLGINL
jgi:CheY-like chemotaxis protein